MSITAGTLFASAKLPLRCYLATIAIFTHEVKGKSALAPSRDLCVSYKCAFVLLHKLWESMADELKGRVVSAGKVKRQRWMGAISVGSSSLLMSKHIAVIGVLPGTSRGSAKLS